MARSYSFLFIISLVLSSCASHKYSSVERIENQTISFQSNAPNAKVVIKGFDSNLLQNVSGGNAGTYGQIVLPSMKKKYLTLEVSAPNYNPELIVLERKVRSKALVKSIALSFFLYGLPIIIDPFRSDFYQLKPMSKSVEVILSYSDNYYLEQYQEIDYNSANSFDNYIREYPSSPYVQEAIERRDELEFRLAIEEKSEEAIDQFISNRASSHLIDQAMKVKDSMLEARLAFENAKKLNSTVGLDKFLTDYPLSIYRKEAVALNMNLAISDLVQTNENSVENVHKFLSNYLIPYSKEMEVSWVESAIAEVIKRYFALIEDLYPATVEGYSIKLKMAEDFKTQYTGSIPGSNSESGFFIFDTSEYEEEIKRRIFSIYFERGLKEQNSIGWKNIVSTMNEDFPNLCSGDLKCFWSIINLKSNKNFELVLQNDAWVKDYFKNLSEFDRMISFKHFKVNGSFKSLENFADFIKITYQNDKIVLFEIRQDNLLTCSLVFKGESEKADDLIRGDYFVKEKLVYRIGNTLSGNFYNYEFVNGVNVTLENHQALIVPDDLKPPYTFSFDNRGVSVAAEFKSSLDDMLKEFPNEDVSKLDKWKKATSIVQDYYEAYFEWEREQQRIDKEDFFKNIDRYTWKSTANGVSVYMNIMPVSQSAGAIVVWSNVNRCMSSYTYTISSSTIDAKFYQNNCSSYSNDFFLYYNPKDQFSDGFLMWVEQGDVYDNRVRYDFMPRWEPN